MNNIKINMKNIIRGHSSNSNNLKNLENRWNQRFFLDKIPQYDSYKDINFLSLGLIKTKLKDEENKLKYFKKNIKKSKTNPSHLTLDCGPKKNNFNIPSISSNSENEKVDLFSLKFNNNNDDISSIIQNQKDNYYQTQTDINNKSNKKQNLKKIYNYNYIDYDLKANKTEQNSKINFINNKFIKEVNELKELWKILGVTPDYQMNFWNMVSKFNSKDIIDKYLIYEKNDLLQFKSDLEKLNKEIYKRENDLNKLKQIDEVYAQNLNMYNFYRNLNSKFNEKDEKNEEMKENNEKINEYKKNKENIEKDIENILKSLRLHTINTISLFVKFRNQYNYLFTNGKIDNNCMTNGYNFNKYYLLKIKTDTNFLQNTSLIYLYDFSKYQDDPFFLGQINNDKDKKDVNNNYKYLSATEDTLNKINQCMFIIDQEEIMFKINQTQINNFNISNKNEDSNKISFAKINKNLIGTNLNKEIRKLSGKKIKKLFFNTKNPIRSERQTPLFNVTLTDNFNNRLKRIKNQII